MHGPETRLSLNMAPPGWNRIRPTPVACTCIRQHVSRPGRRRFIEHNGSSMRSPRLDFATNVRKRIKKTISSYTSIPASGNRQRNPLLPRLSKRDCVLRRSDDSQHRQPSQLHAHHRHITTPPYPAPPNTQKRTLSDTGNRTRALPAPCNQ